MSIVAAAAAGASARVRVQVGGGGGVPSTPQNLAATTISASQINLAWDASTGSPTHYNIYRDEPETPTVVPTRTLIATSATNSYSNTGLQGLTRYEYFVSAENAQGESALSASDTADTDAPAGTIWVSPAGGGNGLTQETPTTLGTANSNVALGGFVAMLTGNYGVAINPAAAGTAVNEADRITYKNVPGQTPVVTSGGKFFNLSSTSYVTVDGIEGNGGSMAGTTFSNMALIFGSDHIDIKNCSFNYTERILCVVQEDSIHIRFINNYWDFAGDLAVSSNHGEGLHVRKASRVLVEGNTFRHCGHNLIRVTSSSTTDAPFINHHVVVRNNDLNNDWADIYGAGAAYRAIEFTNTEYCVFEDNLVYDCLRDTSVPIDGRTDTEEPNTTKLEGFRNIGRRNFIFNSSGTGINQAIRTPETPNSSECRIYNNSHWGVAKLAIGHAPWRHVVFIDDGSGVFGGNTYKNNIVRDSPQPDISIDFNTTGINALGCAVISNCFYPNSGQMKLNDTTRTLAAWETTDPPTNGEVRDNLSVDPAWVGGSEPRTKANFALDVDSALINAGDWLTVTASAGSGTSLPVEDARYFYDGHGIEGLLGDLIQLEGQTVTARITAVNYDTNTLTLDTPLTWGAGDGVAQPYSGAAPDIGAVET